MTTTIRISDPIDLVKVVPYQLGYHPDHSLVLIGLRRKQIGIVQRLDLPTLPHDCGAAATLMAGHLQADGCTAGVIVVYEDLEGEGAAAGEALARRLRADRIDVVEHVVVRNEQVFFPAMGEQASRPVAGVALPPDDQVPAIADFVAVGRRPAPSRTALDERIAPEEGPLRERVRVAAVRLASVRPVRTNRAKAMSDWGSFLDVRDQAWFSGPLPSAAAAARMGHSLRDLALRDVLTACLCPGTLELEVFEPELQALARAHLSPSVLVEPDRLVERLTWLARHTPQGHAPGVLTVLASLTWYLGDGAFTRVVLDRVLALDPAYRLALLLERMLDLAIRPVQAHSSTG